MSYTILCRRPEVKHFVGRITVRASGRATALVSGRATAPVSGRVTVPVWGRVTVPVWGRRRSVTGTVAPTLSGHERGRQGLRAPGQDADVCADEEEGRAGLQVVAGHTLVEGVDAHRFAGRPDRLEHLVHGGDDVRVALLSEQPHGRGEVGRTDEDTVNPVHGRDVCCGLDSLDVLDLDEQRDVLRGVREIAVDPVPAGGAGERGADATDATG